MEKPISRGTSCSVTILFVGGVLFSIIAISTLSQLLFGEGLNAFHVLVLAAAMIEIAIARYLFTATLHEIDGLESRALWISMGLICLLIIGSFSVSLIQEWNSKISDLSASVVIETASRSALLFLLFAIWFAFPAWRKRHAVPSVIHFGRLSKPRPLQRSVYEAVFQN